MEQQVKFHRFPPRIAHIAMARTKLPYLFLGIAAVLALSALALLVIRPGARPAMATAPAAPPSAHTPPPDVLPAAIQPGQDPGTRLTDPGSGMATATADELVGRIASVLAAGDFTGLTTLIGSEALDAQTAERLRQIVTSRPRLSQPDGIREIGELELNTRSRWAIQLDGGDPALNRLVLDLRRAEGKWTVEKITLPAAGDDTDADEAPADSLGVADTFLRSLLNQDFELARTFVDPATVTDVKIAGLCILFEEGGYRMRRTRPLRCMFQRADTVGYLANVVTSDGSQGAQFSLTLRHPPAPAGWRITEINLDQLLTEYARRVAGGDVHYSPLVRNPSGGETIALYFGFDEDAMAPRTRRQLEIVSLILKADPGRKISLSGHTDSLGSDGYNNSLSARRARTVRDFLTDAGVDPLQITTIAKGASQPRRPNVTETGDDNPDGRRVNRRTEIYLDF